MRVVLDDPLWLIPDGDTWYLAATGPRKAYGGQPINPELFWPGALVLAKGETIEIDKLSN